MPDGPRLEVLARRGDAAMGDSSEVYRKHADALVRFASGLVGPSDAADVVSDAVVKAMWSKAWPSVRNHGAYLYRSVLNEARMHHRGTMRRRARELAVGAKEPQLAHPVDVRPEVLAAVGRLSVRQRAVVFLTYWEGLQPHEIGNRLGIGEGSVRRHLARARQRLRGMLHE